MTANQPKPREIQQSSRRLSGPKIRQIRACRPLLSRFTPYDKVNNRDDNNDEFQPFCNEFLNEYEYGLMFSIIFNLCHTSKL